jgi:O-antigen/teichoic acid export membrane protein
MAFNSLVFGGASGAVLRATATIAVGAVAAKLIGVAAMPIITRIYGPEDFGVLAVFAALAAVLGPLMTLSYSEAIPLPRTDQMALNVMALGAALLAACVSLFFLVFFFLAEPILRSFSMEAMGPHWWLIGVALIGATLYDILSMWAVRKKAFRLIAKTQISQAVSSTAIKVSFGLLGIVPVGLLLGQIAKQSGGISSILREFLGDLRRKRHAITIARMGFVAHRYRKMPIFKLPSQILARFANQGPVLFMAVIFDASTTGQFGLATMAVALPMTLLSRTTSKAYYAEIAAIGRRKPQQIREVTYGVLKRLAALAALPALLLFLLGPDLLPLMFGDRWAQAGQFASQFALFVVFKFLAYPTMHLLDVFDRQGVNLQLNVQRFILLAAVFACAWLFSLPPAETVQVLSIALMAHYSFIILRCIRCIPQE